jgi:hypothetical protein
VKRSLWLDKIANIEYIKAFIYSASLVGLAYAQPSRVSCFRPGGYDAEAVHMRLL